MTGATNHPAGAGHIAKPVSTADRIEQVAAIVLDRLQISAADLAREAGVDLKNLSNYTRPLVRAGRIHRLRPIGPLLSAGIIWAAGRAPEDDGEPVNLSVSTWRAGATRTSLVEAYFFGRAPVESLLGAEVRP